MRDELFNELLESAQEAMAIRRGEAEPSRMFEFDDVDVAELRERMELSQPKFAAMLGISVGTLRGWEQGRRRPEGPARALLRVAAKRPDAVVEALYETKEEAIREGRVLAKRNPKTGQITSRSAKTQSKESRISGKNPGRHR